MGSKNHILLGVLRVGRVILLCATLALIGSGSGALFTNSVTPGYFWDGTIRVDEWPVYSGHIIGQFFIFVSCLFLAAVSMAMLVGTFMRREAPWLISVIFNSIGACIMLLGGVLEMWYATGWTDRAFSPTLIIYRVNAWYAASVFFLFNLATFIGDIIIVLRA